MISVYMVFDSRKKQYLDIPVYSDLGSLWEYLLSLDSTYSPDNVVITVRDLPYWD